VSGVPKMAACTRQDPCRAGRCAKSEVEPRSLAGMLPLSCDEVHVWGAHLDTLASRINRYEPLLSPDERARAERFRFDRDRSRFVVTRAVLRSILAEYVPVAAEHLQFSYNAYGKPSLDACNVKFNVSHSGGVALIALTMGCSIGVDVERIRELNDVAQLARSCCTPREYVALLALPPAERNRQMFTVWTRKEAYAKALGTGLAAPLTQIDLWHRSSQPDTWWCQDLAMPSGYAAALAIMTPRRPRVLQLVADPPRFAVD
jgi:4'-phosphopantetheinyl transferase